MKLIKYLDYIMTTPTKNLNKRDNIVGNISMGILFPFIFIGALLWCIYLMFEIVFTHPCEWKD